MPAQCLLTIISDSPDQVSFPSGDNLFCSQHQWLTGGGEVVAQFFESRLRVRVAPHMGVYHLMVLFTE